MERIPFWMVFLSRMLIKYEFPYQNLYNLFILMHIEALKISFWLVQKPWKHKSWLAGRGWLVVVAELIPVTWLRTGHLIGSNQIFSHDHDRIPSICVLYLAALFNVKCNKHHHGNCKWSFTRSICVQMRSYIYIYIYYAPMLCTWLNTLELFCNSFK